MGAFEYRQAEEIHAFARHGVRVVKANGDAVRFRPVSLKAWFAHGH